jgi:DNA polymerase-3 subunit gamma/tau
MQNVSLVVERLAQADQAGGLDAINQAVSEGADARQLARQIVEHLRMALLVRVGGDDLVDLPAEERARLDAQTRPLATSTLIETIKLFSQAASDLRTSWQPQLLLELAYLEAVQPATAPAPAQPVDRPAASSPPAPQTRPDADEAEPELPRPSVASETLTLDVVQARWETILDHVRKRRVSAQALLKSSTLTAVEDGTLVLSWPSETLKQLYEKDRTKRLIESVIARVLGQPIRIRCVVNVGSGRPDLLIEGAKSLGAEVAPSS